MAISLRKILSLSHLTGSACFTTAKVALLLLSTRLLYLKPEIQTLILPTLYTSDPDRCYAVTVGCKLAPRRPLVSGSIRAATTEALPPRTITQCVTIAHGVPAGIVASGAVGIYDRSHRRGSPAPSMTHMAHYDPCNLDSIL